MHNYQKKTASQKPSVLAKKQIEDIEEAAKGTFLKNLHSHDLITPLTDVEELYFPKTVEARELSQIANFIQANFGFLTDKDILQAFIFNSKGVLGIDYTPKSLSIDFCRNVLKNYGSLTYQYRVKPTQLTVITVMSNEEKYNLFVNHVTFYKSLPNNPDWVSIFEHFCVLNNIANDWGDSHFQERWNHAKKEITAWATNNFKITDNNVFKGQTGKRTGLGGLLKESIGI